MKKTITILGFFCTFLFLQNTNAQSFGNLKKQASETVSNDKTAMYKKMLEKPEIQSKVKDQLINNEDLRTKAMSFLQKEPSVKTDVASIIKKTSMASTTNSLKSTSKSAIMSSLLSNPKIATVALGFVKSNPAILSKVMGLIGM